MPELTHPWALLLLLPLPLLLWHWWRRSRGALRYGSIRLVAGLPQGRARRAWPGGLVLRGLGAVLIVLALAGPRWPDDTSRIPAEGISIAMVLDVSASMKEPDFDWQGAKLSRLDGVKKVFRLFVVGGQAPGGVDLPGRPTDLIALVPFATRPETACPLTLDHKALLKVLDAQEARSGADEATTNPGDAIAWALFALKKAPTAGKAIVFLTDGESNVPEGLKPRQAAQLAANLHVPIYAVDAGPDDDPAAANPGDAAEARALLKALAKMTGGQYFRAQGGQALAEACAEIDRIERGRIESPYYRRHHEGFAYFAVAALACWTGLLVLECTRWRVSP